jgi:AraC-like DNA-binding protein
MSFEEERTDRTATPPAASPAAPAVHAGDRRVEVLRRRTHEDRPMACLVTGDDAPPFDLTVHGLGDVAVGRFSGVAHAIEAPRDETDRAAAGIMVDLVTAGGYVLDQGGRIVSVTPGSAVICVNRMPFRAWGTETVSTLSVMVPEPLLSRRLGDVTRLASVVLPSSGAAVRLLGGYLRGIFADITPGDAAGRAMMGRHLVDIMTAAVEESVGHAALAPPSDTRAARLAMMKRFIDANAHLPNFNIHRVAAHFACTERSVQLLFEEIGATFSGTLMERRLSLARERLSDPRNDEATVRAIAESAGFSDPAHFTRAYRRRFGETPGATRSRSG